MFKRRTFRFLALMLFIFAVVVLLARSSIFELRAKAEERFIEKRVSELRNVVAGKASMEAQIYYIGRNGEVSPATTEMALSGLRDIHSSLSSSPGGFRREETFWTYLPLKDGRVVLSSTPYEAVISWTRGFEARETRNVILVMAAFAILTSVWMWADRRAVAAAHKAKMVDELERMVDERTEALKRMDRLARLGEFAASLAHEIRNPLGSLVTAAKLLPDSAGEEQEDLIGVLKRESGRLDRIISDFLSFSRDPHLNIRMIPLNSFLKRSMEGLKRSHEFKHVALQYVLDPNLEQVPCDSEQLERVFWNVGLNGAHAMEGRGTLLTTARRDGRWARISFRDEESSSPFIRKSSRGRAWAFPLPAGLLRPTAGSFR
jgi:signal transduction histidine kinase